MKPFIPMTKDMYIHLYTVLIILINTTQNCYLFTLLIVGMDWFKPAFKNQTVINNIYGGSLLSTCLILGKWKMLSYMSGIYIQNTTESFHEDNIEILYGNNQQDYEFTRSSALTV